MNDSFCRHLRRALPRLLPTALLALLVLSPACAATLTVPAQYATIQAAVSAAANGDTVLVADGTYSGPGNRDIDFGGKNLTVTSVNGPSSTIIDCGGYQTYDGSGNHRGFYLHSGETNAVISGFTVKNGYEAQVPSSPVSGIGGGIYVDGSSVAIQNCILTGNTALAGGGIYNDNTSSSAITLTVCTVSSNSGGGVVNENQSGGTISLIGCCILNNTASGGGGGGVFNGNTGSGTITLTNCTLSGNAAQFYGGGAYNQNENGSSGTITLTGCTITGNIANTEGGGGVYNGNEGSNATITLINCVISSNTASQGSGGGAFNANYNGGMLGLTNCTIASNTASDGSNGVCDAAGLIVLTNDIIFYNGIGNAISTAPNTTSTATATYCDLQSQYPGTGTFGANPKFVNFPSDLHLSLDSPCLGRGTNVGAPATDKDGRIRPNPPSVGAYENSLLTVPAQYATIQAAVNAAQNGDTVVVADGTYSGPGNRDIDFGGKNLTVTSQNGPTKTIIDCGGSASTDGSGNHRGFYIHSGETGAVIGGFTVKNGYETYSSNITNSIGGGGIFIAYNSTAALNNCIISNNVGIDSGGGVFNAGVLKMGNCTISNNNPNVNGSNASGGGGISNSGTAILSNCAVTGNTSGYGGIDNDGTLTLTNCTIAGNTAYYAGGGIINSNALTLNNCTITQNISAEGRGSGIYSYGSLTLTNDIVYGDTVSEIDNEGTTAPVITFSDIQGGYAGTGNINADPLFVNAVGGDFHLKLGSPCLGAGTSVGAPATDKDGVVRPSPPSIGAYEVAASGTTHVLWDNTDGTASIWNYSPADGAFTFHDFGPYPGWTAKALADGGTDGQSRVLWDNASSMMSLWSLNDSTGSFTSYNYGPFAGWTASALSVATDNITHILWNNSDGRASIWNLAPDSFGSFTQNTFGPYPNWSASAIADGPDGKVRVLWNNTDGRMSLWSLNNSTGIFSQYTYGPFPGWSAKSVSVGVDNTTHILWNNSDGRASVWNQTPDGFGSFTQNTFGPYPNWSARAIADGPDGKERLLWDNMDGRASLWSLDNAADAYSFHTFGPYAGWTATAVSAGS